DRENAAALDTSVIKPEPTAAVATVYRHTRAALDGDRRGGTRQTQLQSKGRDGATHAELDGVCLVRVERTADLPQDLRAQAGRQRRAVDDGDGLAQGQVAVTDVGCVGGAVDRQHRRGCAVFQRFKVGPVAWSPAAGLGLTAGENGSHNT